MKCEEFFVSLCYSKMLEKKEPEIHHKNFERLGNRLFERLSLSTQHFFQNLSLREEKGYQLILRWLCSIGTFHHQGKGFYILLPQRILMLNEQVKVRVGSPFHRSTNQLQSLHWKDWLIFLTIPHLSFHYEKRMKNLIFLEELKLYKVQSGQRKRVWEAEEGVWYYSYREEQLGRNLLKTYYVVKKEHNELKGAEFIKRYGDLTFYMLDSEVEERFSMHRHSSGLIQLETIYRLPAAEHSLFLLFSIVERKKSNRYIYFFEETYIDSVKNIISHLLGKDES